jgi:hypothetical protein
MKYSGEGFDSEIAVTGSSTEQRADEFVGKQQYMETGWSSSCSVQRRNQAFS